MSEKFKGTKGTEKMEQTIIMVGHGKANKIARALKVSKSMVSMSLKGRVKSEKAKKIRYVALTQYGGIEMQQVDSLKTSTKT
jgi:predicted transcriptional regulator